MDYNNKIKNIQLIMGSPEGENVSNEYIRKIIFGDNLLEERKKKIDKILSNGKFNI